MEQARGCAGGHQVAGIVWSSWKRDTMGTPGAARRLGNLQEGWTEGCAGRGEGTSGGGRAEEKGGVEARRRGAHGPIISRALCITLAGTTDAVRLWAVREALSPHQQQSLSLYSRT